MKPILEEARIVELQDEELKEFLGHTYEAIKSLDEKKKADPEVARLRLVLKQYKDDCYDDEIKSLKARLKAARTVATARGIQWRLPKELD